MIYSSDQLWKWKEEFVLKLISSNLKDGGIIVKVLDQNCGYKLNCKVLSPTIGINQGWKLLG